VNIDRYMLDTNALNRLTFSERSSDFVTERCRIPTEVLFEARELPDISILKRLVYKTDAELLADLTAVMATVDPGDFKLIDLYHNRGNADPILVAAALHATRRLDQELLPDRWLIVTDDLALKTKAAAYRIDTLTLMEFQAILANQCGPEVHPATLAERAEPAAERWVEVDIAALDLFEDPEYYGPDPYYDSIPWAEVLRAALRLITIGEPTDQIGPLEGISRDLRPGVEAILVHPPIEVEEGVVFRGGHRLRAMQRQGVLCAIGVARVAIESMPRGRKSGRSPDAAP